MPIKDPDARRTHYRERYRIGMRDTNHLIGFARALRFIY